MAQKLALLICADPRLMKEGHSVYVPEGEWEISSNVKDTELTLELVSILSTGTHYESIKIEDKKFKSNGKCFRYRITKPGTEKSLTVTINKCLSP